MAAAGKSTLAAVLSERYACSVIPMDDFFLRPEQRTNKRLAQPGGNIDYERFILEVAQPLSLGNTFSYRPYDCGVQKLSNPIEITPTQLTIIEGVYSMHPKIAKHFLNNIICVSVFMEIDEETQRKRLLARNPALLDKFINEWIPMENKYFDHFGIREKCNYCYSTG